MIAVVTSQLKACFLMLPSRIARTYSQDFTPRKAQQPLFGVCLLGRTTYRRGLGFVPDLVPSFSVVFIRGPANADYRCRPKRDCGDKNHHGRWRPAIFAPP